MSRGASGRLSAIFRRSSRGSDGSCQGASPASARTGPAGALSANAAAPIPEIGVAPPRSGESSAAKYPESQARCSGENGAVSGIKSVGGAACMVIRRLSKSIASYRSFS